MDRSSPEVLDLLGSWNGLGVVVRHDAPTGTWIFIALHDATLGPPVGGCRLKVYESPAAALRDAMRLAEGMTHKWAAIDLPFGGGKSVLAVPRLLEGEERRGLFRRFGELLEGLNGAYGTGEDLGTTPQDMAYLAQVTEHVVGVSRGGPGHPADPGPFTALGVLSGIRAALAHRTGSDDLSGRRVAVQGVGDVGEPLARMLASEGATLLLSDLDPERARAVADRLGASVVEASDIYDVECDVFAPCAVGGVLDPSTIARLRCGIVAGSANNQLEDAGDAERLLERGILYAPDYVVNAGGAMAFGLSHQGASEEGEVERRVSGLGDHLAEIFSEAAERGESPLAAARRRVERVLARGRKTTGFTPDVVVSG